MVSTTGCSFGCRDNLQTAVKLRSKIIGKALRPQASTAVTGISAYEYVDDTEVTVTPKNTGNVPFVL